MAGEPATLAFAHARPPNPDSRYSARLLDGARTRGDPLGDAALAALLSSGRKPSRPAATVRELAESGDPACRALLDQMGAVPLWADFEVMRLGNEAGLRHVMASGFALLCGSLVESYAARDGARMLMRIGRLRRDVYRRIIETLQFVSDIAVERGPRPGSRSFDEALGVRLMHSWARHIAGRNSGWDSARWGHPINQEELAHTVTLFSHVNRRSLQTLGVRLSNEEHEAIHHCWRYTGYLLGVEEEVLARSADEEQELYLWTTQRQYAASADGVTLTKALLTEMSRRPPFMMPQALLAAIARYLVGPAVADELDIEGSPTADALVRTGAWLQRLEQGSLGRLDWARAGRLQAGEALVAAILRSGMTRSGMKRRTQYGLGADDAE